MEKLNLKIEVEYSDDITKIVKLKAMSSPVFAINNEVITAGKVPTFEEIEKAMDDLNIEKQEMTDAEFDQVDKADAAEDDYIKELERLSELHDNGVLTDEEFEAKKKQLLIHLSQ